MDNISVFFFNDTATTEIYTLSLHDALPIYELITGLGYHHNPGEADDETAKIAYIIAASEYICQSKNIGFVEDYSQDKKLFRTCLDKLNMKEKALELIVEEVEEETKKMEKAGWF